MSCPLQVITALIEKHLVFTELHFVYRVAFVTSRYFLINVVHRTRCYRMIANVGHGSRRYRIIANVGHGFRRYRIIANVGHGFRRYR